MDKVLGIKKATGIVAEKLQVAPIVEKLEEVKEEIKVPVKKTPAAAVEKKSNKLKVIKIVQRQPSGFRLLVESGETIRVHKSKYRPGQEFIEL